MNSNPYEAPQATDKIPARRGAWTVFVSAGLAVMLLVSAFISFGALMAAYDTGGFDLIYLEPSGSGASHISMSTSVFFLAIAGLFGFVSLASGAVAFRLARRWTASRRHQA